jgi:mycofactocin precursor
VTEIDVARVLAHLRGYLCSQESVVSESVGTAEVMDIIPATTEVTGDPSAAPRPAEPELATADLLVEEVSIDGMCGVY